MNASPTLQGEANRQIRCALVSTGHHLLTESLADDIRQGVSEHAQIIFEDLAGTDLDGMLAANPELVVVLGGDGSILRTARSMQVQQLPVLGVNLGKIGFLADVDAQQVSTAMGAVAAGKCLVVSHLMCECEVIRDGSTVAKTLGLNEAAILGGYPFSIQDIELYIDGDLATIYSCDGLIISTPVGSTALNLSAGGPILRKDIEAFVVAAVNPHTLTVRPVVEAADRVFEMSVGQTGAHASVVVDGQVVHDLVHGDRVRVTRSASCFRLIEVPGCGYYRTLREKLGWNGRSPSFRSR